jgi:hypothetical protein
LIKKEKIAIQLIYQDENQQYGYQTKKLTIVSIVILNSTFLIENIIVVGAEEFFVRLVANINQIIIV